MENLGLRKRDVQEYVDKVVNSQDPKEGLSAVKAMVKCLVNLAEIAGGRPLSERPVTEGSNDDITVKNSDYWKLETILQRYEASIRDHIRVEQSLKIYSDSLKDKIEALEFELVKLKDDHKKQIQVRCYLSKQFEKKVLKAEKNLSELKADRNKSKEKLAQPSRKPFHFRLSNASMSQRHF